MYTLEQRWETFQQYFENHGNVRVRIPKKKYFFWQFPFIRFLAKTLKANKPAMKKFLILKMS